MNRMGNSTQQHSLIIKWKGRETLCVIEENFASMNIKFYKNIFSFVIFIHLSSAFYAL